MFTFYLTARPSAQDGGSDCIFVGFNASGHSGELGVDHFGNPRIKARLFPGAHHGMEPVEYIACRNQRWHRAVDQCIDLRGLY